MRLYLFLKFPGPTHHQDRSPPPATQSGVCMYSWRGVMGWSRGVTSKKMLVENDAAADEALR